MTNLLLIGAGKFGQNYIKTIANDFPDVLLTIATKENWQSLIMSKKYQGVIIATQPEHHIPIAIYSLQKGIATLIEKPLSLSLTEAQTLLKFNLVPILVNHIHLFAKDYQSIKQRLLPSNIKHIKTVASSGSSPRNYSRLWDYFPHDAAQIIDIAQEYPSSIKCVGKEPNFTISMEFGRFTSITDIGYSETRQRLLDINNGEFIYDGMQSKDLPLTNAIQIFIDAISGKPDYRLGLDLPMKIMHILNECQKQLHLQ